MKVRGRGWGLMGRWWCKECLYACVWRVIYVVWDREACERAMSMGNRCVCVCVVVVWGGE